MAWDTDCVGAGDILPTAVVGWFKDEVVSVGSTLGDMPYLMVSSPTPTLSSHIVSWLPTSPHVVYASLLHQSEEEVQGILNRATTDQPPSNLTCHDIEMQVSGLARGLPTWSVTDMSGWHDALQDYEAHQAAVEAGLATRRAERDARRAEKAKEEKEKEEKPAKKKAKVAAPAAPPSSSYGPSC